MIQSRPNSLVFIHCLPLTSQCRPWHYTQNGDACARTESPQRRQKRRSRIVADDSALPVIADLGEAPSDCTPLSEGLRRVESDHSAQRPRWEGFSFARARCLLFAAGERAMQGSPGKKIGEGAFSDVHSWAPGQVVKLFKS